MPARGSPEFTISRPPPWHSWLVRLTDRLTQPQRIVLVIAAGVALAAIGVYVTSLGEATASFGWYAYAPLSSGPGQHAGLPGWLRLLIWLALTALWALASLRLLRPAPPGPAGD